jgi:hypothetical protein
MLSMSASLTLTSTANMEEKSQPKTHTDCAYIHGPTTVLIDDVYLKRN